jgi:hypothetical protein
MERLKVIYNLKYPFKPILNILQSLILYPLSTLHGELLKFFKIA